MTVNQTPVNSPSCNVTIDQRGLLHNYGKFSSRWADSQETGVLYRAPLQKRSDELRACRDIPIAIRHHAVIVMRINVNGFIHWPPWHIYCYAICKWFHGEVLGRKCRGIRSENKNPTFQTDISIPFYTVNIHVPHAPEVILKSPFNLDPRSKHALPTMNQPQLCKVWTLPEHWPMPINPWYHMKTPQFDLPEPGNWGPGIGARELVGWPQLAPSLRAATCQGHVTELSRPGSCITVKDGCIERISGYSIIQGCLFWGKTPSF